MRNAIKRAAACLAVATVCFTAGAAPLGTNIWIGPPTGGMWTDPSNWKTNDGCAYTSEFLLKTNCLYNFTALRDGAVVTNDGTKLIIEGLRFNDKQGTITLYGTSGSSCRILKEQTWNSGTGTTVNVYLRHPIDWWHYDTKLLFASSGAAQNSGTWRIAPICGGSGDFQPYRRLIEPCQYTKLYLGSPAPSFTYSHLNIWDNAQVILDANLTVGQVCGAAATRVDLNGHTLTIGGGEIYRSNYVSYSGSVEGTGNVTFAGGAQLTFYKAPQFTGDLRILTGDVIYGNAVKIPSAVHVKTDRSGILRLGGDQTLVDLSGEGTSGGVLVTNASTLTVAASAGATNTFNARLFGAMDLVKDGPGTFGDCFGPVSDERHRQPARHPLLGERPVERLGDELPARDVRQRHGGEGIPVRRQSAHVERLAASHHQEHDCRLSAPARRLANQQGNDAVAA